MKKNTNKYLILTLCLFLFKGIVLFAQPVITLQPTSVTTCSNTVAYFDVGTSAVAPTYQWYMCATVGGVYVVVANNTPVGAMYSGTTTSELNATFASLTTYYYKCVITSAGTATTSAVSMTTVAGNSCGTGVKTYGGSSVAGNLDYGYGLVEATDGGIVFVGESSFIDPNGPGDAYIAKINTTNNGAFVWGSGRGSTDASNDENFKAITKNTAGNYIVTGIVYNNNAANLRGDLDLFLAEYPYAGSAPTWVQMYGKTQDEWGNAVIQHSNGNYYIAGHSDEWDAGTSTYYGQFYTGEFSAGTGNRIWTRHVGFSNAVGGSAGSGGETEEAFGLVETGPGLTAGDILVTGYTNYGGNLEIAIIRQNSAGTLLSTRRLTGSGNECGNAIIKSSTGKYVIVGYTNTPGGAGGYDMYIAVLNDDATTTINWQKTIGTAGNDYGESVVETSDGGFVIAGYTGSDVGVSQAYIVKVSSTGTLVWTRTVDVATGAGGLGTDVLYSIVQMSDGNLAMVGITKANPDSDILLIILDANGNVSGSCTSGTGGTLNAGALTLNTVGANNNGDASTSAGIGPTSTDAIGSWLLGYSCGVIILPIELKDFSVKCDGNKKNIAWTTALEQNNKSFTVEHSKDGITWEDLGTVRGVGTSIVDHTYNVTYNEKTNDYRYYRLKQTDLNGNETLFEIVTVNCIQKNNVLTNLYPNPATNEITLELSPEASGNMRVQILDVTGRVVIDEAHPVTEGNQELKMSIAEIVSGIYYLKVAMEETGYTYTIKLIKN